MRPADVHVLDATPLLMGYTPALRGGRNYTTHEILAELNEETRLRLEVARNWVEIQQPTGTGLRAAKQAASITGDSLVLSAPDLSVLALSLDLIREGKSVTLLTDDYAVQNVASKLQIPFRVYAWRGIRRDIQWQVFCPTCRKTYNTQARTCPNCGSTLKRRASRGKMKADVKP